MLWLIVTISHQNNQIKKQENSIRGKDLFSLNEIEVSKDSITSDVKSGFHRRNMTMIPTELRIQTSATHYHEDKTLSPGNVLSKDFTLS